MDVLVLALVMLLGIPTDMLLIVVLLLAVALLLIAFYLIRSSNSMKRRSYALTGSEHRQAQQRLQSEVSRLPEVEMGVGRGEDVPHAEEQSLWNGQEDVLPQSQQPMSEVPQPSQWSQDPVQVPEVSKILQVQQSSLSQQPGVRMKRCPFCGTEAQSDYVFCLRCGNRLSSSAPLWPEEMEKVPSAGINDVVVSALKDPLEVSADEPIEAVEEVPASIEAQEEGAAIRHPGHLILRSLSGETLREYALDKPEMLIGRAPNCDIVLAKDRLSSRHHALIRYEKGKYVLQDKHSANGTYLNGGELEESTPLMLHEGDSIEIGAYQFIFRTPRIVPGTIEDETPTIAYTAQEELERQGEDVAIGETLAPESAPLPVEQPVSSVSPRVAASSRPSASLDEVRFTAFHPQEAVIDMWHTLLVYVHIETMMEAVYRDADLFHQELDEVARRNSGLTRQFSLSRSNVTIIPECRGVLFNPKRITVRWTEDWHRSIFRFSARKELAGLARSGKINIFAGPLLIATLRMAMLFDHQENASPIDVGDTVTTTKLYQHIFAAYSPEDTTIARACQNTYKMLGLPSLADSDQLRTSADLHERVKGSIESAEILQLFWSKHAAMSSSITKEWEYALQLNRGESFIRPVYWEVPLVPPPDVLEPFHFSYLPPYTFSSPS